VPPIQLGMILSRALRGLLGLARVMEASPVVVGSATVVYPLPENWPRERGLSATAR